MTIRGHNPSKTGALGVLTAGALLVTTITAHAGGFAIREQSAVGQGASFAGVAAGGAPSSSFWNPATITQTRGFAFETDASLIAGYANNSVSTATLSALGFGGTGNVAQAAVVPSGYASYQLTNDLWAGVAFNAPFGLSESFPDSFAGRAYGNSNTSLKTYNFNPMVAWRINDWISVGVGFQAQYAKVTYDVGIGPAPPLIPQQTGILNGSGWGYGATAGATLTPGPNTQIGVGWRSAINQSISGTFLTTGTVPFVPPFTGVTTTGGVTTSLKLPDIVSLGVRQRLDQNWAVMATAEWTNWSRIGTSNILLKNGSQATLAGAAIAIPFQYRNGQFYSLGAEYIWTPATTLRAGVAYEISPIDDMVRIPALPDNDRVWISGGLSHKLTQAVTLDFAYSHAFVKSPTFNLSPGSGNPTFNGVDTYIGTGSSHFDIFTVALRYAPNPTP
jgi:long-chain fatty acid transport protein